MRNRSEQAQSRMSRCGVVVLSAALATIMPLSSVKAGIVMKVLTESFTNSARNGKATVYMAGDRLRIDSTESGADISIIYRTQENGEPIYWIVDNADNSYKEVSKSNMDAIRQRTEDARREMEKRMQSLSAEQQRSLRKVYKSQPGLLGKSRAQTIYKAVSAGSVVNGWECTHYEGYRADEKLEEVWAAGWSELGIEPDHLSVLAELADMMRSGGQDVPAFFRFGRGGEGKLDGFPVLVVGYANGQRQEKSELVSVTQEKIDPQLFELPKGLTRRAVIKQK